MKTPPPDKPFDPDDPNVDPWADDPNAPKEPGYFANEDEEAPWSDDDFDRDDSEDSDDSEESSEFGFRPDDSDESPPTPTPTPIPAAPTPPGILGPAALFDSQLRGEIEFEILFQQTKAQFRKAHGDAQSSRRAAAIQWPVVVALAFWGGLVHGLAGLAAVLFTKLLHELGHFLGQHLFGYREREIAPVAFPARWLPTNNETSSARRVITFLLGPLPGIALALVLQALFTPSLDGPLQFLILILLAFNLADLWVAASADGGRVFERIPFLRGPRTIAFANALGVGLLAAAATAAPGLMLKILLGFLAVLVALGTIRAWRVAKSRQAIVNIFEVMPERQSEISDTQLRTMLHMVLTIGPESFEPADLARAMHTIHERAARPAMTRPTAIALFVVYLFGWLMLVSTTMLVYANIERHRTARDQLVTSFHAVLTAPAAERAHAAEQCQDEWRKAVPLVRREAWRQLDEWLNAPPQKPESILEFVNALKVAAPPNE